MWNPPFVGVPTGPDPPPEDHMPQPDSAREGVSVGVCVRTGSWGATQCGQLDGRVRLPGAPVGSPRPGASVRPFQSENTMNMPRPSGGLGGFSFGG
jgi:hypothetical protein